MNQNEPKSADQKLLFKMKVGRYILTAFVIAMVVGCAITSNWIGAVIGSLALSFQFGLCIGLDKGTKIVYEQWENSFSKAVEKVETKKLIVSKRPIYTDNRPPMTEEEVLKALEDLRLEESFFPKKNC